MAVHGNPGMVAACNMNTACQTSATVTKIPATPERGFLSSLQKLINTAGMVSVDLTDTIFASMPRRDGAPYEAIVKPKAYSPDAIQPTKPVILSGAKNPSALTPLVAEANTLLDPSLRSG